MILVMLYHGLRVSELVALTNNRPADWGRRRFGGFFAGFEDDGMDVLVVRGKGEKDRVQPAKKMVMQAIETYLRHTGRLPGGDDGLLFRNCQSFEKKGKYQGICTRNVNRILADRLEVAGIVGKRLIPHSLRATAATKLLNTPGVTLPDVQGFLGHASITTTVRYTRLTTDLKKSGGGEAEVLSRRGGGSARRPDGQSPPSKGGGVFAYNAATASMRKGRIPMPTFDNPMPPFHHEYPKPKKEVSQRAADLGLQPIVVQCLEPNATRDDPSAGMVFLTYVNFIPRSGEHIVIEDGGCSRRSESTTASRVRRTMT